MGVQLTGKLVRINPTIEREGKNGTYTYREFVILIEKYYKKKDESFPVKFEVSGNKCIELDSRDIQDALKNNFTVNVNFEFSGRFYTDKTGKETVYNTLKAQTIVVSPGQLAITNSATNQLPTTSNTPPPFKGAGVEDDLPF